MKIDRNSTKGVSGTYRSPGGRPVAPQPGPASGAGQVDQITVSEKASRAARVKSQLSAVPEARVELIARLKEEIDSGAYRVESRKLAEKLLKAKVFDE